MKILISNSCGRPIYEQIMEQIKTSIMDGELLPGDMLPGMRTLAQDLKISLITTKRAYNELENEGFITTVVGKGCFVSDIDPQLLRENGIRRIEERLEDIIHFAKMNKVSREELESIVDRLYKEVQ